MLFLIQFLCLVFVHTFRGLQYQIFANISTAQFNELNKTGLSDVH